MIGPPHPRRDLYQRARRVGHRVRALGDAGDWLRSDWQPVGSTLTDAQGDARSDMQDAIAEAKAAINKAKDAAYRAIKP